MTRGYPPRAASWWTGRGLRPHSARRLPADYKEYVHWFGPGDFDEYLIICVPGVENSTTELAARLARERNGARLLTQIVPKMRARIPLFPEPGGWLPWGFTTGGDGLYWVTSGDDPDRWTIAGRPGRGTDFGYFWVFHPVLACVHLGCRRNALHFGG